MRQSIFGFSQRRAVQERLSITDLVVLDTLNHFFESGECQHIVVNERKFYWIEYTKMQRDLPMIVVSDRQWRNIINDLIDKRFIDKYKPKSNSTKMYFALNLNRLYEEKSQYETFIGRDTALEYYKEGFDVITPEIRVKYGTLTYRHPVIKASQVLETVGKETFVHGLKIKLSKLLSKKVYPFFKDLVVQIEDKEVSVITSFASPTLLIDNMYKIERAVVDTYIALLPKPVQMRIK